MTDEVWYYAEGERQKGPVSADDLKELVEKGHIKPTDLVWQPGMGDWVAANTIRGLVPDDLQEIPLENLGKATIDAGFDGGVPRLRRRRRRSGFQWNSESLDQWGERYGKLLLLSGLLLVVLARGCDSLGAKYAKRQQVMLDVAKAELDRKQVDRQNQLMQSSPLDLETASRAAASNHIAWQPLYELFELVGSFVLAIGLLLVAFTGEPIERWGCWILLGVLLLHLYFGNRPIQP